MPQEALVQLAQLVPLEALVLLVPLVNVVQVVEKVKSLIPIAIPMEIKFNGIMSHGN